MRLNCDICTGIVKATRRLKDTKAAAEGYIIICSICKNDAKSIGAKFRCNAMRVDGKNKCRQFRYSVNSPLCRYHWRRTND